MEIKCDGRCGYTCDGGICESCYGRLKERLMWVKGVRDRLEHENAVLRGKVDRLKAAGATLDESEWREFPA